jgi:hypothetical protein
MKKQLIAILLLLSIQMLSQTKLMIYKIDGTVDSVLLSQISNITFSSTTSPVSTQGLVAYYPFDGTAADSSGNGYNGSVFYATPTQNRFGVDSNAYNFDGVGNAIDFGNILNQVFCAPVAKFSVSGWVLIKTYGQSQYSEIIGKNAGGTYGQYQWSVSFGYGSIITEVFSDTNGQNYIGLKSPVSLNQWVHFVLVFDGSQPELQRVQLYVNGTSGSTSFYAHVGSLGTSTMPSQATVSVGAAHTTGSLVWNDFLNGYVDDIRIYNRALSATEVLNLYLAPN